MGVKQRHIMRPVAAMSGCCFVCRCSHLSLLSHTFTCHTETHSVWTLRHRRPIQNILASFIRYDREFKHTMAKETNAATAGTLQKDAVLHLARDDNARMSAYGKASFSALRENTYVTVVAAFAVIGALCFGIDQGMSPKETCLQAQMWPLPARKN